MRLVRRRWHLPSVLRFGCCFCASWRLDEFAKRVSKAAPKVFVAFTVAWDKDIQPTRCLMRAFRLRSILSLAVLALTTTTFAGVRGKPTQVKQPAPGSRRIVQNDTDYSVNAVPVPTDVKVLNERVIQEIDPNAVPPVNDPTARSSAVLAAPGAPRSNYVAVPVMVIPMMAPAAQPMQMPMQPMPPMPMMAAPGCAACGGMTGGLNPAAAAAYEQTFGPGLYRSGAEAGQYHFPYYSYRRPWYFPGQPSFQRSTDYVW